MNLFDYGGRHFKMMLVPAKNIVIFSDDKKLEDYEDYGNQFGGDFYEVVPSTLQDGFYDLTNNFIGLYESTYLLNIGFLQITRDEIAGSSITWAGIDPNTRNAQGNAVLLEMNYPLYLYNGNYYINVNVALEEVVITSTSQEDGVDKLPGKPNMVEALAEGGNPEFTYFFFISEDGFKVEQAYVNTSITDPKSIAFYMETSGGSNAFGSVIRLRSGREVLSTSDFALRAVRKILGYHNVDTARLTRELIQEHLLDKKEKKEEGVAKIILEGVDYVLSASTQLATFPLWLLDKSFTFLSEDVLLKYAIAGTDRWQYYTKDDTFNPNYSGIFSRDAIEAVGNLSQEDVQVAKDFLGNGLDIAFAKAQQELAPWIVHTEVGPIASWLNRTIIKIKSLTDVMVAALKKIAEWVIGFGKEVLIFTNGLLVGLWNSLVEILRGVFDLLALICQLGQTGNSVYLTDMGLLASQLQMLVETLENGLDWCTNLFTIETGAKLLAFYMKLNQTIVTSVMNVNADRAGYLLGFVIGVVVEELLDAFFTGGIKNVSDIAGYLEKSVNSALSTVQQLGDAVVGAAGRTRRMASDVAGSAMDLMRSINRMLRMTMDPAGLQKFLDLIVTKFEEFILGVKIDLLVKGQQPLGGALYSNIPFDDFGKFLGKKLNKTELRRLSRLGVRIQKLEGKEVIFKFFSTELTDYDGAILDKNELNLLLKRIKLGEGVEKIKKGLSTGYRKPTRAEILKIDIIRNQLTVSWRKNVAYTEGNIGNDTINLISRSGSNKQFPDRWDNFDAIDPLDYHYVNGPESFKISHTEQKQIEYLFKKYKHDKQVKGTLIIVSELEICDNCVYIIDQFNKDFPNVNITRIWIKNELNKLKS